MQNFFFFLKYYKENPFVISIISVVTLWGVFLAIKKETKTGVSAEESVLHPSPCMCLILSVRKACFSSNHICLVFMVKAIPSLPAWLLLICLTTQLPHLCLHQHFLLVTHL